MMPMRSVDLRCFSALWLEELPSIEPVWSADVSLDVDAVIYRAAQWRMWYDRAVRLFVTTPDTSYCWIVTARRSLDSPGAFVSFHGPVASQASTSVSCSALLHWKRWSASRMRTLRKA